MRIRSVAAAVWAAAFLVLGAVAVASQAAAATGDAAGPVVVAHDDARGSEPRELEPRYQPVEPEPKGWYNTDYFFALSRTIAGSTLVPAAKVPLWVVALPCDIALLPFAAIGGLFG